MRYFFETFIMLFVMQQLANKSWSVAVDCTCGGLLDAFIVSCHKDLQLLRECRYIDKHPMFSQMKRVKIYWWIRQSGDAAGSLRHWIPPDRGTIKLNLDASFFAQTWRSYIGAIAGDFFWCFFYLSKSIDKCSSVEEAEAQAMLDGLTALTIMYNNVCFPTSCDIKTSSSSVLVQVRAAEPVYHRPCPWCVCARTKENILKIADIPAELHWAVKSDCKQGS
ncbi:uncharacterized protein LOC119364774 [Triticum dicoccoides]|uniref:uncharacterized protein LOC119364774 n=1 Tax=Triticum dicoccoides TaxID=85692 RepID=UPI00188E103D|nr:uncharacterized protein LOC119364774 [Triticum dicoccoides]